jgi:hypothetical protein
MIVHVRKLHFFLTTSRLDAAVFLHGLMQDRYSLRMTRKGSAIVKAFIRLRTNGNSAVGTKIEKDPRIGRADRARATKED